MSTLPAISSMNKSQLTEELHSYDVDVKPKWCVAELRELIKEFRKDRQSHHDPLKGLSQKTKLELTELCQEANIRIPDKATRGLMMLLLREHYEEPVSGSSLVDFGEHKGKRYDEVPDKYLEWASKEETPGKQLKGLIRWHSQQRRRGEEEKTIKNVTAAEPSSTSSAPATPLRSSKRSSASSETGSWMTIPVPMDQSCPQVASRIQDLEAQLAILKRQQATQSGGGRASTPSEQ
jgi:uncharacterized protein (DUF3820 family)